MMEKKGMPNHLQSLACVDNPTDVTTIIRELEDAGEVGFGKTLINYNHFQIVVDSSYILGSKIRVQSNQLA